MAQDCMHDYAADAVIKGPQANFSELSGALKVTAKHLHTCKFNTLQAPQHTTCPSWLLLAQQQQQWH